MIFATRKKFNDMVRQEVDNQLSKEYERRAMWDRMRDIDRRIDNLQHQITKIHGKVDPENTLGIEPTPSDLPF